MPIQGVHLHLWLSAIQDAPEYAKPTVV
jgi:hypothetical protein